MVVARPSTARRNVVAIVLEPELVAVLRAHLNRHKEENFRHRGFRQDIGLVFPNLEGGHMSNGDLSQRWLKTILKKAQLPKEVHFYDLRHTFAILSIEADEPGPVLQKILGHTSFEIAFDLCIHTPQTSSREPRPDVSLRRAWRRRWWRLRTVIHADFRGTSGNLLVNRPSVHPTIEE